MKEMIKTHDLQPPNINAQMQPHSIAEFFFNLNINFIVIFSVQF